MRLRHYGRAGVLGATDAKIARFFRTHLLVEVKAMQSQKSRRLTLVAPLLLVLVGLGAALWFVAARDTTSEGARRVASGGTVERADPSRTGEPPPINPERAVDAGAGRSARAGQPIPRFVNDEPAVAPPSDPGTAPAGGPVKFSGDRAGVTAALKAAMPEIRQCYREWLKAEPNLQGKVSIEFRLSAASNDPSAGKISGLRVTDSSLSNTAMEGCVMSAFEERAFDAPAQNFKSRFNVVLSTDPNAAPP
jgi:hypothetical protein